MSWCLWAPSRRNVATQNRPQRLSAISAIDCRPGFALSSAVVSGVVATASFLVSGSFSLLSPSASGACPVSPEVRLARDSQRLVRPFVTVSVRLGSGRLDGLVLSSSKGSGFDESIAVVGSVDCPGLVCGFTLAWGLEERPVVIRPPDSLDLVASRRGVLRRVEECKLPCCPVGG